MNLTVVGGSGNSPNNPFGPHDVIITTDDDRGELIRFALQQPGWRFTRSDILAQGWSEWRLNMALPATRDLLETRNLQIVAMPPIPGSGIHEWAYILTGDRALLLEYARFTVAYLQRRNRTGLAIARTLQRNVSRSAAAKEVRVLVTQLDGADAAFDLVASKIETEQRRAANGKK